MRLNEVNYNQPKIKNEKKIRFSTNQWKKQNASDRNKENNTYVKSIVSWPLLIRDF